MKTTIRTVELLEGTDIVFHPNDFIRNPLLYNTTQIGHVVCGENHSVSRNGYSSFGIYSVTEGTVKLTTKNGAFYAKKGDLLFFDQSEKHLVENGGTIPYEADFAYIFGPNIKEFFEIFYEKFGYVAHDFTPPSMKSVWKEIVKACRENREDIYLTSSLLYGVLTEILKFCGKNEDVTDISAAISFVTENYDKAFTLDELAGSVSMDKYYLIRQFRARTGYTPKEYQNELRLNKAEKLLKTGNLSVTEIAKETGFTDIRAFLALFKKRYGVSPSVYLKNLNPDK